MSAPLPSTPHGRRRGGWLPIDVPASQRPRSLRAWRAMTEALAAHAPPLVLVLLNRSARPEQRQFALWLADGTTIPLVHLGYDDERGFHDVRGLTE